MEPEVISTLMNGGKVGSMWVLHTSYDRGMLFVFRPEGLWLLCILRPNAEDPDSVVPLASVEASFPAPSRRVTGKRPLVAHEVRPEGDPAEPSEVPSNYGDPLGPLSGHSEAAGVWTDEEGPAVRVLGDYVPRLMTCTSLEHHAEPSEVPSNHGDPLGHFCDHEAVAVRALRPLSEPERRAEDLAKSYLEANIMAPVLVLQLFETLEEVRQLFTRAARRKPKGRATSWATGAFTHGGVSGLRDGAKRLPNVTRFLAKFAREFMGAERFAAVAIQRNGGGKIHRDFQNFHGSRNWLYLLRGWWLVGSAGGFRREGGLL